MIRTALLFYLTYILYDIFLDNTQIMLYNIEYISSKHFQGEK